MFRYRVLLGLILGGLMSCEDGLETDQALAIATCNWSDLPTQTVQEAGLDEADYLTEIRGSWRAIKYDCSDAFVAEEDRCPLISNDAVIHYNFFSDTEVRVTNPRLNLEEVDLTYLIRADARIGYLISIRLPADLTANGDNQEVNLYWNDFIFGELVIDDSSDVIADVCRVLYQKE
ncbi:MAG: hypothetical protein AAF433_12525 [Bacteroidota bacterium]